METYRLYYIYYSRAGERYGRRGFNVHLFDYPYDTFKLPKGMTRGAGFKVLSYLTDYIEKSPNIEVGSNGSVNVLNNVLNLKRLGFRKVDINLDENTDNMINLFTVGGRALLFKYSEYYQKYIE